MKQKALLMIGLFLTFRTSYGEIIESTLIHLNDAAIILWGDKHTPYGSDIDIQQLKAIKRTLLGRPGNRPLNFIVEEPATLAKIQNWMTKHILIDARNAAHKHPYYKPFSTENIEMRGVGLAAAHILDQPKIRHEKWNYLSFNFDDAHGIYPLKDINMPQLRQAFQRLLIKSQAIVKNKKDRFGQPLWASKLNEAVSYWQKVKQTTERLINTNAPKKTYPNKTKKQIRNIDKHRQAQIRNISIHKLKYRIDQLTEQRLSNNIVSAFSALFDIILADRVLALVNNGYDVAVLAGADHTRSIQGMIIEAYPQARTVVQLRQPTEFPIALPYQDINVFERSRPWWHSWRPSWIPDITIY